MNLPLLPLFFLKFVIPFVRGFMVGKPIDEKNPRKEIPSYVCGQTSEIMVTYSSTLIPKKLELVFNNFSPVVFSHNFLKYNCFLDLLSSTP